jgi:hypothetical protein
MSCPDCGGERRQIAVPEDLREYAPEGGPGVVVCTTCLRAWSPTDAPDEPAGEASDVSDSLPSDERAAVALVLATSLLSSVARNEAALAALFDVVERAGADPRLALERLADDPDRSPAVDVRRRLRQFEGLR